MSRLVRIWFEGHPESEGGARFIEAEDAASGTVIDVGRWVNDSTDKELWALEFRMVDRSLPSELRAPPPIPSEPEETPVPNATEWDGNEDAQIGKVLAFPVRPVLMPDPVLAPIEGYFAIQANGFTRIHKLGCTDPDCEGCHQPENRRWHPSKGPGKL